MFVALSVHLLYVVILSHCLFCILPTSRLPNTCVMPCFIRIPKAILGLNGSGGQMEMMGPNCVFLATKQQKCRTVDLKQQKTAYTLISCGEKVLIDWKVV